MKIDNKIILENSKDLNILYVEDDKFISGVTAKLFKNFFNSVDIAVDGEDGVNKYKDYIKKNNTTYDLVISDINMPKLDGIEMCNIIKHLNFEQAIILISAHDETKYFLDAIRLGVNGFLIKPIEITQLQNVLYTTALSISDRKIVQKYYEDLENNYQKKTDATTKTIEQEILKPSLSVQIKEEEEVANYAEYFIDSDISELKELEEDIDSLAIQVTMGKDSTLEESIELANNIKRYGDILAMYPIVKELGEAIKKLGISFLENAQLLYEDKQKMENISALVEGFVNDLIMWRKEIFDNNTKTPHALDASFFSNVDTIIMFIEYDETQEVDDEGDIDFF